jgi:hypothetical protein
MRTTVGAAAILLCLVSSPLAGQEIDKPSTVRKADDLEAKMRQMRDDYQELLSECWGRGYYVQEPDGLVSWFLSDAPDATSCKNADALKRDYRAAYEALLKLDRRRVLFDDIPKYIDRP